MDVLALCERAVHCAAYTCIRSHTNGGNSCGHHPSCDVACRSTEWPRRRIPEPARASTMSVKSVNIREAVPCAYVQYSCAACSPARARARTPAREAIACASERTWHRPPPDSPIGPYPDGVATPSPMPAPSSCSSDASSLQALARASNKTDRWDQSDGDWCIAIVGRAWACPSCRRRRAAPCGCCPRSSGHGRCSMPAAGDTPA